jgi:hypothetical protein
MIDNLRTSKTLFRVINISDFKHQMITSTHTFRISIKRLAHISNIIIKFFLNLNHHCRTSIQLRVIVILVRHFLINLQTMIQSRHQWTRHRFDSKKNLNTTMKKKSYKWKKFIKKRIDSNQRVTISTLNYLSFMINVVARESQSICIIKLSR